VASKVTTGGKGEKVGRNQNSISGQDGEKKPWENSGSARATSPLAN